VGTSSDPPQEKPATAPGGAVRMVQRFGYVTGRHPSATRAGHHPATYLVRDDETGLTYSFGYADIVTEGLRTIRSGEHVRFLIDHAHPGRASYVIRLDLPDISEYYK
jgi:hypothetical protein